MEADQYVKGEAERFGLGLGSVPNMPVYELITIHRLRSVLAELPSGDEFFWIVSDETLEPMLGTKEREHVNHDADCSECVRLSCTINDVYSFRATLTEGKVTELQVFSQERGEFSSKTYSTN
jgi:hypothetical protein